jgi:branched-chain amino acid transport system substrate-binding protein
MRTFDGSKMLLALAPVLLSCSSSTNGGGVTLGACISLTGYHDATGPGAELSIQTAVEDINSQGGLLGGQLSVDVIDDQSDPTTAATCATTLVSKGVPAIIGTLGADTMAPALGVTIPANIDMISDFVALGDLPNTISTNGLVFSTASNHVLQGQLLADRAYTTHSFNNCAIIQVAQAVPGSLANGFSQEFTALGGTISNNITVPSGQSSYASTLQTIYAEPVQCILMATYVADGIVIMQNYLSNYASKNTFWFFGPIVNLPAFQTGLGASNFTFNHEGIDSGNGPGFNQYNAIFQKDNPTTTLEEEPGSYDDVYLLALAIEAGQLASGVTIKNNMRDVSNPPGTVVFPGDWGMAVSALQAGQKIEYQGATGVDTFDSNGQAEPPYIIWAFQPNGNEVTVCSWNATDTECS